MSSPDHSVRDLNPVGPRIWRGLSYLGVTAAALVIWYFRAALTPLILAVLLAYILAPAVAFLQRHGFNRLGAIITTYALLTAGVIMFSIYVVPRLITQLEQLTGALPEYTAHLTGWLRRTQEGMYRIELPSTLQRAMQNVLTRWEVALSGFVENLVDGLLAFIPHTMSIVAAPVLAFYLLKDQNDMVKRLFAGLPERWREDVRELACQLNRVVMGFIRSRLLIALLVGSATAGLFLVLGLPYSLLVGLVAGLADLIPYFGPVLGAVPALTVAALDAPATLVKVGVALLVIQQVESALISPLLMSGEVNLHPAWVVVALFAGAQAGGFWGMVLAVPVLASAKVLCEFALKRWPELNAFFARE